MIPRLYQHLLFWTVVSLQGTLLQYSWRPERLTGSEGFHLFLLCFVADLFLLPVKILFTYYALTVIREGFLQLKRLNQIIQSILIGLLGAIFFHRLIGEYLTTPYLNPGFKTSLAHIFSIPLSLISLMDLGYVTGIACTLKLFRLSLVRGKQEKDLIKEKLGTELKFLKNQINPHFLFNTLNNIYALARKKSDKTPQVVLKLSKLLRFMLYESGKGLILISEELKVLEDYIELEKIRYNDRLEVTFITNIDDQHQSITPLILLPFIENAFKHGTNKTTGISKISICLEIKNGQLNYQVTNSKDRDMEDEDGDKIGLRNVRRQLELMYADFTLDIKNEPESFFIHLFINLNSYAAL